MTQLFIRKAVESDLEYLFWADLSNEGYTSAGNSEMTKQNRAAHREKIRTFMTDSDKQAWVLEDNQAGRLAGMILFRFRNRVEPSEQPDAWLFQELPINIFPSDGRFCEVFNLRVEPQYRRHGYATLLKNQMELVARQRGVCLLYTHTEETNIHVLELNRKLGYLKVRCGPIWDEVFRVSLVKRLDKC
jgi:ribosomal protein S18 acetylase RimI-like enzyme